MSENGGRIVGFDGRYQRRVEPSPNATGGRMAKQRLTPLEIASRSKFGFGKVDALLRFEYWTEPEPNTGCLLWMGFSDRRGYGRIQVNCRPVAAHRWAYEQFVGPIADGLFVCHRCDQTACVNPDHLFLGDHQQNMTDMANKGRGTKSRSGLPFGVRRQTNKRGQESFRAQVHHAGQRHYSGPFPTIALAAEAAISLKEALIRSDYETQRRTA